MDRLPDQLEPNLRVVFVGTAAGQMSADLGHYYAHPGNRFWRTLHAIGLTPRLYQPHEFPELLALGIGFTDMCKDGAGMDHVALRAGVDVAAFTAKMRRYRPRIIAFTSKKAASLYYGRPTTRLALGLQARIDDFPAHDFPADDFPDVFVLASPSGAASGAWTLAPWLELAAHLSNT
jgi:TDG/mug DNA glycosylase family protein